MTDQKSKVNILYYSASVCERDRKSMSASLRITWWNFDVFTLQSSHQSSSEVSTTLTFKTSEIEKKNKKGRVSVSHVRLALTHVQHRSYIKVAEHCRKSSVRTINSVLKRKSFDILYHFIQHLTQLLVSHETMSSFSWVFALFSFCSF